MLVQTGDYVGIGGFIITGDTPKHLLLRAMGPSMAKRGVPNVLRNPALELRDSGGSLIATNKNWRDTQETAIQASGMPPGNDLEAAIDTTLPKGAYTAIVTSEDGTSGLALFEVYDLDPAGGSKLANISTRAVVTPGDNTLIAGFILAGQGTQEIVVRGMRPSLLENSVPVPVPGALMDPVLQLRDANGVLIATNNDWEDNSKQRDELIAAKLEPSDPHEAAIAAILPPGNYTALLNGEQETSGVGLVEIYDRCAGITEPDVVATVTRFQTGTFSNTEAQHVKIDRRIADTFRLVFTRPSTINRSDIGSRAALEGTTAAISVDASAADIEAAIKAMHSYFAYGQTGNLEGQNVSFDYFATIGATNRDPIVTGSAKDGFTIQFGSSVGTTARYNTWVANLPLVGVAMP